MILVIRYLELKNKPNIPNSQKEEFLSDFGKFSKFN